MNNFLYWLDQIHPSQQLLVGEKVVILSKLQQQGYPVLPSFVITAVVFHQFLEQLNDSQSILADFPASSLYLNVDNPQALQLVARQSRETILKGSFPSPWLSSLMTATNQLNSSTLILRASIVPPEEFKSPISGLFPAQVCWNTPEAVELALKTVWASLFSAKSLFYWQRMGIGLERVNLAILVQPIYNAQASGIARIMPNRVQIQANWGLGHSLLQGEVLPDSYEIQSNNINRKLGNKTRAYRLKSQPASPQDICLEAYQLSETEQTNFCLDDNALTQLTGIVQPLASESNNLLEWTLTQLPDSPGPQFYIVQSNLMMTETRSDSVVISQAIREDTHLILKGLSASKGVATAEAYIIPDSKSFVATIPEGKILVTKNIIPDWLPWLKQVKGVIAQKGGITSHAAIIARELGIPAIVGATGATELIKTGDLIRLDGNKGEVYQGSESTNGPIKMEETAPDRVAYNYPIGTKLMVNLSQLNSISNTVALPVDGVGLIRSELMLLELFAHQPLQEWLTPTQKPHLVAQWSQLIHQFAQAFAPRPVFYRSLDWVINQENKQILLRHRGISNYQENSLLFDLELEVLKQVYELGDRNINLILPFVRSVEEFSFCRHRVEQVGLTEYASFQLWIMAEVPSVIFLLSEYVAAGVQGIAIGTNDLTHLLFGLDREETKVNYHFPPTHPAMLKVIEQLITQAKLTGIPCSICGQAPVDYPELIDYLIDWGITAISVEPDAIESTYKAIARAEQRLLLEKCRKTRD